MGDFVHTAAVVDAVIAVLAGGDGTAHTHGLPAEFWTGATALKLCEHGDLADWVAVEDWAEKLLPGIIVRGTGTQPGSARQGGDGAAVTAEPVRVVHLRRWSQCRTDAGAAETNMSRARERYAKIIGKALFADPNYRLATVGSTGTRTEPTLTCADTGGASLVGFKFVRWDLGQGQGGAEEVAFARSEFAPEQVWAIACDLEVSLRSGGKTAAAPDVEVLHQG